MDAPPPRRLPKSNSDTSRRQIWDCASSLYDSFELASFHNHLLSAIAADSTVTRDSAPPQKSARAAKIPRALQKLFRSVFRTKHVKQSESRNSTFEEEKEEEKEAFVKEAPKERYYYVFYDKLGALSTIPEAPEFDAPPKHRNFVRRTASARVSSSAVGIWC